jgi:hypothetical protein
MLLATGEDGAGGAARRQGWRGASWRPRFLRVGSAPGYLGGAYLAG